MSVNYAPILWNRQKKIYDRIMLGFIILYLALFMGLNALFYPEVAIEILIIRATATLAFIMLHIILAIGPLARLNTYFLPLLYNRRHLGVSMFLIALIHAVFSLIQFHALGDINPFLSIFVSNGQYSSLVNFPFQSLGFLALLILFLMASSSHDYWLKTLSPKFWKAMHMLVYVAYALIIMHVALGVLQLETSSTGFGLLALGMFTIIGLHVAAGIKEVRSENKADTTASEGFIPVCDLNEIQEDRAKVFIIRNENIAVFKYDGKIAAINNVCKHQNGPLGEGKIIDGCITCPWHGYQYLPESGQSPPPFTEKVHTYSVKIEGTTVFVNPTPHPEGTPVEPAKI